MTDERLRPALALAAWTLFVWTTRIRNIWTDTSATSDQIGRTVLALVFTGFAVMVVVAWFRVRRGRPMAESFTRTWIRAFALWTCGVWAVRVVQIATAGHDAAFVAVHTVLAVVSIVLAVVADRSARARVESQPVPEPDRV